MLRALRLICVEVDRPADRQIRVLRIISPLRTEEPASRSDKGGETPGEASQVGRFGEYVEVSKGVITTSDVVFYSVHVSKPICLCVGDNDGERWHYTVCGTRERERINNCG